MSDSAVARVFGIAELRELILLELPNHENAEDVQKHPHQPVIQLFELQRVNRDFRDTIISSAALGARMTTPPLIEIIISTTPRPQNFAKIFGKHIGKTIDDLVKNYSGSRALQQSTKDASWRQLKARSAEDVGQPRGLWYEPKPMGCSDWHRDSWMNIDHWRWAYPFPGHHLTITKDTTWGQIFDWVIDAQLEAMEDFMGYLDYREDEA